MNECKTPYEFMCGLLTQQIEHTSMSFPLQELLENANSNPHHVVKFEDVSRVILHLGDATEISATIIEGD